MRARHNELQRIEATLTDLAAMFADMAQIVEAQDPVIEHTEQNAQKTADDVDKGKCRDQQGKRACQTPSQAKVVLLVGGGAHHSWPSPLVLAWALD